MNLDLINSLEEYWGEVVDVNDPLLAGRVKVRVKTIFDDIAVDYIPWASPKSVDSDTFEKPFLGERVQVKFHLGDIMMPKWYRIRISTTGVAKDDYEALTILKNKDLSKYGLDGSINVAYSKSQGLTFSLDRNEHLSEFTVRNDNTIFMKNGNSGKIIHLSDEGIAIGRENKAQQPAVVGDDNQKALEMLNDTIKELSNVMSEHLDLIASIADRSPYTKHLKLPLKAYKDKVKSTIKKLHSKNDNFFPETKSTFVTIDKT